MKYVIGTDYVPSSCRAVIINACTGLLRPLFDITLAGCDPVITCVWAACVLVIFHSGKRYQLPGSLPFLQEIPLHAP
jgi:hypothetical protein